MPVPSHGLTNQGEDLFFMHVTLWLPWCHALPSEILLTTSCVCRVLLQLLQQPDCPFPASITNHLALQGGMWVGFSSLTPFPAGPVLKLQSLSPGCPEPLWTAPHCWVSIFLLIQFPQPLLAPTCTMVSPGSALGTPAFSASICGLPILSLVLPGPAQDTHCSVPCSPEAPGQLILHPAALLISCLCFPNV